MTIDDDVERRLASGLRNELDPVTGPHPVWASSPAAARIAARRGGIRWPGRLLAVSAVLAITGGVALAIALREADGVAGCPTLHDYAAASAQPTLPLGQAPGVSFPPVAPDATPTTGLIEPGEWAVIVDGQGPVAQMRIRDVRACGRLPDYRSGWIGGSIYLARADVRVLRDDRDLAWLGAEDAFYVGVGGTDIGRTLVAPYGAFLPFGIPGIDRRTTLGLGTSFASSSDVVLDVPATDLLVAVYAATLSSRDDDQERPLGVGWRLRPGPTGDPSRAVPPGPSPGATQTTGELRPGEPATVVAPVANFVVTVTDVQQVTGYPGRSPAPGNVFLEARLALHQDPSIDASTVTHWRAVDGEGRELPMLANSIAGVADAGVLQDLAPGTTEGAWFGGWFVVEAPSSGPVWLELRRDDDLGPVLTYVLRD